MNGPVLCALPNLLLLLALTGCSSLPNRIISFNSDQDCAALTEEQLPSLADSFGPASTTESLQCALTMMRTTKTKALLMSALPARLALHLAERQPPGPDREALAAEGVKLAERALKAGGQGDAEVHYYLAANLGLAINDHPVQAAENIHRLEDELTTATRLAKQVDQGGPLRLLGMLYLKAPPWPTGVGDGDKALQLLREAVMSYPAHPLNHLFYAEALFEVDEKRNEAQAEIAKGQRLLKEGPWGYNKDVWQKEFAEMVQEIRGGH